MVDIRENQLKILITISNNPNSDELDLRRKLKKKNTILQSLKNLKQKRLISETNGLWKLTEKGDELVKDKTLKINKEGFSRVTHKRKGFDRSEHTRKEHSKKVKGKNITIEQTEVKASKVPPSIVKRSEIPATSFRIEDLGGKGRGQKVVPPEKLRRDINLFNKIARDRGFIKEDQSIGNIPNKDMKRYARVVVDELKKKYKNSKDPLDKAVDKANGFFNYMANVLRKRQEMKGFKLKMEIARKEVIKWYPEQVKPVKAIAKWKDLPSEVRKAKVPSRKNNPDFVQKEIEVRRGDKIIKRKQWVKKKK